MTNDNKLNLPNDIDLSSLNIAYEIIWLNILHNGGYINDEEYYRLKLLIKKKYT